MKTKNGFKKFAQTYERWLVTTGTTAATLMVIVGAGCGSSQNAAVPVETQPQQVATTAPIPVVTVTAAPAAPVLPVIQPTPIFTVIVNNTVNTRLRPVQPHR